MKKVLNITALLFLFALSLFSQNNYSGIYEAVVQTSRGKQFVRFQIFRYDFKAIGGSRDMYDRTTGKTVYPIPVIGKVDIYEKKKPNSNYETYIFRGVSYERTDKIEITGFKGAYRTDAEVQTFRKTQRPRKFELPKSNMGNTVNINLMGWYNGAFKRVGSFTKYPEVFNKYLIEIARLEKKLSNQFILAGTSSLNSRRLYNKLLVSKNDLGKDNINIYLETANTVNLVHDALSTYERHLNTALNNRSNSLLRNLDLFPNLKRANVILKANNNLAYTAVLKSSISSKPYFLVTPTASTKEILDRAEKADLAEFYRQVEERKKREQQKEKEEQEKAAKAKEEMIRIMSETTPTGEPTEDQMRMAYIIYASGMLEQLKGNDRDVDPRNYNVVDAVTDLFTMGYKNIKLDFQKFEKYNCIETGTRPGFTCDYLAKVSIGGGTVGNMFGALQPKNGTISTARFSRVKGLWILIEIL